MPDIGYYTLPVILSFQGIDKQVNDALGDKLKPAGKKAGEDYVKGMGEGVKAGSGDVKKSVDKVGDEITKSVSKAGTDAGKKLDETLSKSTTEAATNAGKKLDETLSKSAGDAATNAGKKVSDGLAKAAKDAAGEFGGGFLDGVREGLRDADVGPGARTVGESIVDGIQGPLDEFKGAARDWAMGIGDDLRSGNIQGATSEISTAIRGTTDLISDIGDTFGLQTEPVRTAGEKIAGTVDTIGGKVQTVLDKTGLVSGGFDTAGRSAQALADTDMLGGKLGTSVSQLAKDLPIIGQMLEAILFAKPYVEDFADKYMPQPEGAPHGFTGFDLSGSLSPPGGPPPPPRPTFSPTPHRAGGGPIIGSGGGTSDIIPIWASNGEHMLTAEDVKALGGQTGVYQFRNALHRAGGGEIGPDVLAAMARVGTPYSQANRNDCSGMVAQVVNQALGLSGSGLMSTKTAKQWLAERGFVPGIGGRGQITVGWYDHGPNPNDGHMAMTLSNGQPAEAGGSHGNFLIGAGAKGANWGQFDQHMFLPNLFGEGAAGSSNVSLGALGGAGGTGGGTGSGGAGALGGTGGGGKAPANITKQFADKAKSDAQNFLGGLMQTAEGGIKETLGLGDVFPDPTETPLFKSVMGGLTAFEGPIKGLMAGKLGIQQPGWRPGMPVDAMASDTGGGGGGGSIPLPFGLPDIELPPAPGPPEQPGAGGAPGQPVVQNNDLSVTYNGPVGSDPAEVRRQNGIQQDKGLAKVAPISPGN